MFGLIQASLCDRPVLLSSLLPFYQVFSSFLGSDSWCGLTLHHGSDRRTFLVDPGVLGFGLFHALGHGWICLLCWSHGDGCLVVS